MTGNTNKTRAVFLAMLMVFSVFAGTVAFSGSAAADAPTYGGNAVHYANSSGAVIEVPFEDGNVSLSSVNNNTLTILDDGDNISSEVVTGFSKETPKGPSGAVLIELNQTVASEDLEVDISDGVVSQAGDPVSNPGEKSVVFAGDTKEFSLDDPGNSGGFSSPSNDTVFQGVTIAVNVTDARSGNSGDRAVTVRGEDNNYFAEGSTGTNSSVFTFDTGDRELGEYEIFTNDTDTQGNRTFVTVRALQLDIGVDDLNVTTDDTIETTVTAVSGSRDVEVELLDSSGDDLNTSTGTLDGQGERDFDFNTATADDGDELDPGTYTVEVTDQNTGVVVESSEIQVSQADDEEASFAEGTLTEERGDILEVTVEMTETSEATINFGSPDDGVEANATVEDDDGDDQVTVYINTYRLSDSADLPGDDGDVFNLDSDSDDNIIDQQDLSTGEGQTSDDLLDTGDYDLEVQAGDRDQTSGGSPGLVSSDDVATVTLNERSTESVQLWTGSADEIGSVSDLEDVTEGIQEGEITQSSEIAVGDLAVHQLQVTGLEGALNARADEDVSSTFSTLNTSGPLNLTIEEADPGANQDAAELQPNYGGNVTVIGDGPNDTYFIVVDTDTIQFRDGSVLPEDDDTALETNFTILSDDNGDVDFTNNEEFDDGETEETLVTFDANEPDINVAEPFNVSQAEAQTVTGDTNIAPGTELSLRIRSDDGVSPSFLKTASPVVQSDGTYSATFDFSEQSVGDTYDIEVDSNTLPDGPVEEDGEVVGSVATDTATSEPDTDTATPEPDTATPEPDTATPEPDTATPEPDTATPEPDTATPTSTPTSTPGFGVIVALTALLAAALLAVRRD